MPEGAEVKRCSEVIKGIADHKVLTEIKLTSGKLARNGIKNSEKLTLPSKIIDVYAYGKSIFIELEKSTLVSTLGMSGWWYPPSNSIQKEDLDDAYYSHVIDTVAKAEKHTRLQLVFEDNSVANFVDPRNFGNFYIFDKSEANAHKSKLGLDFLNLTNESIMRRLERFPLKYAKKCKYGKQKIGEILLDQSWLAGLGNIYRAETMYLAKISPHRRLCELTESEIKRLMMAADHTLVVAYNGRGHMSYPSSSMEHFLNVRVGDGDGVVNRHLVYGCNIDIFGNPVVSETLGGRTCWWVPNIQT